MRLPYLPIAVRRLVEAPFKTAQFRLHLADAGDQDADSAASGAEQRRDADREHMRVIVCLGEVAPDRKPKATANDIDPMTAERTMSENNRRERMAGFPRVARGRMVPVPLRYAGYTAWSQAAAAFSCDRYAAMF